MPACLLNSYASATLGLAALVVAGHFTPVLAQSRAWVPWGEIGAQAPIRAERPQAASPPQPTAAPRAQRQAAPSPRLERSERGERTGQVGPQFLDGGGRPAISPSTPPTVAFTGYATGSVVVDTGGRALYYVTSPTQAYRYPISVGRDGFTWRGTQTISRVAAWPDWRPPAEMRERDPRLPELMSGGIRNPLGATALYLGSTLYRIHGTNDTRSIGVAASSGCFRMTNSHVLHLATKAGPGTRVHVLDRLPRNVAGGAGRAG